MVSVTSFSSLDVSLEVRVSGNSISISDARLGKVVRAHLNALKSEVMRSATVHNPFCMSKSGPVCF